MDNINPYQSPPESIDAAINDQALLDPNSIQYASRWLRLGGVMIDGLFGGILFILVAHWNGLITWKQLERGLTSGESISALWLSTATYLVLNGIFIYTRGQTIGKLICGTVVVNKNDFRQVSGTRYIFLRILPMVFLNNIPGIGDLIGLANSLAIFRSEKNCLHDDIAGTRVIMRRDLAQYEL